MRPKLTATTTAVLMTMLLMAALAGEAKKPGFTNITQAVEFLAQCLHQDDLARLTNACVRPFDDAQMHSNVFVDLKEIDAHKPLTEIYSGKEFPTNTSDFTMGGHAKELGFINIPFVKTNGVWFIRDYFYCR